MSEPEFLFDFGSPNAYLAHRVIPAIESRTGAKFVYVPVLLGGIFKATGNRSPVEAFAGIRNKLAYDRLETDRFIARHGIDDFQWNPHFPVNTLALMRGAVAATRLGVFERYVETMFRAMWEEGRKMDDPQEIAKVLSQGGFDAERLMTMTQDPEVKKKLIDNTERAVQRGAFGAPTFFVSGHIYFGKDRLRDVEEAIVQSR